MKGLICGVILGLCVAGGAASAQSVPVMVGGEADYDACMALGEVTGLDPDGDNFLSVRTGPGTRYREKQRLGSAHKVIVCEERGAWLGIVYADRSGGYGDCGVFTPIEERQRYRGPCKSGWVFGRYVRMLAG